MNKLSDLAYIVRSKNAGPFFITLDILFQKRENYERVRDSGVITTESIAKLYKLDPQHIEVFFFDNADGIKITYPRKASAGDFGDTDCYGAQQHAPLINLMIP